MATFGKSDPRAALNSRFIAAPKPVDAFGEASYLKFRSMPPQEQGDFGGTWYGRGQNFLVAYTEAAPGATLSIDDHPDEYLVLAPDTNTTVEVRTATEHRRATYSLFIVPPGSSTVVVSSGGRIFRFFTTLNAALAAKAVNAQVYAQRQPNVLPYQPWPGPRDGYRLRCYSLDIPLEQQVHGRMFRSSNLLIYISRPRMGPRDKTRVTPHHHEGFEQGTINLEGEVIHHVRWPWMKNMTLWREDEHVYCPRGSLAVIPPPSVHTTEHISPGLNMELVVYSPPRADWAEQPGWVMNAGDYPLPPKTTGADQADGRSDVE